MGTGVEQGAHHRADGRAGMQRVMSMHTPRFPMGCNAAPNLYIRNIMPNAIGLEAVRYDVGIVQRDHKSEHFSPSATF